MSDPILIILDDDVTIECIESWNQYWVDQACEARPNATTTAMRCDTINRICELAKQAVRMKKGSKNKSRAVAAEMLRQMADKLDSD